MGVNVLAIEAETLCSDKSVASIIKVARILGVYLVHLSNSDLWKCVKKISFFLLSDGFQVIMVWFCQCYLITIGAYLIHQIFLLNKILPIV